jgi:uncharacterized protein (TIGR03067 family)
MKCLACFAIAGLICCLVCADDKRPAAAAAPTATTVQGKAHEGVWKPIAAILGGAPMPQPALAAITLKITGENYEVTIEGEGPDKGTCILDTSTTPKRMTIKGTDGPNKGKTFLAIYEMKDAGSLRVCYDLSGTEFPKEFKAPKGTALYLVGYRRQKE